jgi:hypothetical protein
MKTIALINNVMTIYLCYYVWNAVGSCYMLRSIFHLNWMNSLIGGDLNQPRHVHHKTGNKENKRDDAIFS